MTSTFSPSSILRGTPVVPGVAYAPVVIATASVSPAAVAAFEQAGFADAETALAAYDVAAGGTADGLTARAAHASGAAAEVLTAMEDTLAKPETRTVDLGGTASTAQVTEALIAQLR